ncbi:putative carbohydrate esterase family 9 protein [Lyophyllum shimeji]|uniref:Carbohydrate esterase family 9 protein n=1 Tax=Lyophyllum shimeji TaxID=47721 RepID=A0A9P3PEM8_LYOSH|nr:putative carbohydrate esterase family 9 protein [Lyophyllum shimeji]
MKHPHDTPLTVSLRRSYRKWLHFPGLLAVLLFFYGPFSLSNYSSSADIDRVVTRCESITTPAGPPSSYSPSSRVERGSDRYVEGTAPVLIKNARIWTGANNGTEAVYGDILLDKGLVMALGHIPRETLIKVKAANAVIETFDVQGKWVTPGLVDLHSHIGLSSAPELRGAADTNSRKAPILPWLRSIDGLNTHDASYQLAIAGGVTTAQILPGSANNIGGQSFLIKLRTTKERSATSKVIEPPQTLIHHQTSDHLHWRHMKHACGENPSRVYSQTRMDSGWSFRQAYDTARKVKEAQDAFCTRVRNVQKHGWWPWSLGKHIASLGDFPEDLQWESLVDVLRGRVKLSIHCYEAVDLDAIIRLSNEFNFPIASLHHAGETYLVPDLLKKAWGGVPSIALFASNARKKREAYRNSEFAPKVLADEGIPVVMKSDHPVLNSRYLLYEAQQAHYYGLDADLALASVTSTPAKAAGLSHRIGSIAVGYDADIAIWDSHPLSLGATPAQVYIDGIAQIRGPHVLVKPEALQHPPKTPDWEAEARKTIEFEGLPPLRGRKIRWGGWSQDDGATKSAGSGVKFVGVKSVWTTDEEGHVHAMFDEEDNTEGGGHSVVVRDGSVVFCSRDSFYECDDSRVQEVVDLQGGSLAPGLTTFGSPLGLAEIRLEPSTTDGVVKDPLTGSVPGIVGGNDAVIRAVDGLQFEGRNTLLAYRAGVTRAVTAPVADGFLSGLSTTIDTGASSAVERGAIIQEETALHISVSLNLGVSVSTQIATLRRLLHESTLDVWERVRTGVIPLVVNVDSADIMATLLNLKSEYERLSGNILRLTFAGASEAHLLAEEIGKAEVSAVLTSPRPYPGYWEQRRILPGPPLSRHSTLTALLAKNVHVAIGVVDEYNARNARFDIAWAALESNGTISKTQAIRLATTYLNRALGATSVPDLVAYRGGSLFDFESKIVGVVSLQRGIIELF